MKVPRCPCCRPGETPDWFVTCIAYAHTAGEIAHYCTSGHRIVRGVDELEGEERAYAASLVAGSAALSRANARSMARTAGTYAGLPDRLKEGEPE